MIFYLTLIVQRNTPTQLNSTQLSELYFGVVYGPPSAPQIHRHERRSSQLNERLLLQPYGLAPREEAPRRDQERQGTQLR